MLKSIEELLQFHRQRYHVGINLVREAWEVEDWNGQGILIGITAEVGIVLKVGELVFQQDESFIQRTGDALVLHNHTVGVQGENFILLNVCPLNNQSVRFIRNLIDERIPKIARELRKKTRLAFLNGMLQTAGDRKTELTSLIREQSYSLDDLTEQVNRMSRDIAMYKRMLAFFQRPEDHFKRQTMRMFSELMKLVPGNYTDIRLEEGKIIGTTQRIVIAYEDHSYDFEPYEVVFNLNNQKVQITGDKNTNNGYCHPHVTTAGSICWGNIAGLVAKLSGEFDLYGLFELIGTFLSQYNEDDPYQKIERWDPNWTEDDEENEPYCSFCDETGHEISECEWCWWCEHCEEYADHYEEDCPNRQQEEEQIESTEEEVIDADVVAEPA